MVKVLLVLGWQADYLCAFLSLKGKLIVYALERVHLRPSVSSRSDMACSKKKTISFCLSKSSRKVTSTAFEVPL